MAKTKKDIQELRELITHMRKGSEGVDYKAKGVLFNVRTNATKPYERIFGACALGCVYTSRFSVFTDLVKKKIGNYPLPAVANARLIKAFPVLSQPISEGMMMLRTYIVHLNDDKNLSVEEIAEKLETIANEWEERYNGFR